MQGDADRNDFELAARITARYGKGRNEPLVSIRAVCGNLENVFQVRPLGTGEIPRSWYL